MGLAREYDPDFIYFFWNPYPKKVGKDASEKEFLKLKFDLAQKNELRDHIEERKRHDKKWVPNEKGVTFIVDPERFLKHRRFEDDYERVAKTSAKEKRYYDVEPPAEEYAPANPEVAREHLRLAREALH